MWYKRIHSASFSLSFFTIDTALFLIYRISNGQSYQFIIFLLLYAIIQTTLKVIHTKMSSQAQNSQTDNTHTPNQRQKESRELASFAKTLPLRIYIYVWVADRALQTFQTFTSPLITDIVISQPKEQKYCRRLWRVEW